MLKEMVSSSLSGNTGFSMKGIFLILVLVITANTVLSQTMVVKKGDGGYEEIPINNSAELWFYIPCPSIPTVTYAGKTYNTVQIGSQCWLKENLNVGTMIDPSTGGDGSGNQTNNSVIEKYCYSDDEANCTTYGGLYQWAEAVNYQNGATNTSSPSPAFSGNIQGICPSGWHIPTKTELQTLSTYVSSDGNALKSIGQGIGSGAGTNTSGFSTLLAGYSGSFGIFFSFSSFAYFWSSTEWGSISAYYLDLFYNDNSINFFGYHKTYGLSVRCCKD